MRSLKPIQPLLVNFVIWLLGLCGWTLNPVFSMDVLIHEFGHTILALSTGCSIVAAELSAPHPHVDIECRSRAAENISLTGGFLFTFVPYLIVLLVLLTKESRFANFIIWPLFSTFPASWHDFRELGIAIPHETVSLAFNLGSAIVFFLLNRSILRGILNRSTKESEEP